MKVDIFSSSDKKITLTDHTDFKRSWVCKQKYPYAYLYIWMTQICLGIVFLNVCINGGSILSKWLFHDVGDTGNDFFNCIPAVKGYGLGYGMVGMYPPLARLFFLLMARIYSYHNIPLDTAIRHSITDPRMQQAALVPFIVFILLTSIIIIILVCKMFHEEKQNVLIGASIVGTYSVLFAIERGNYIILSLIFLIYFIAYYRSENKLRRETAFIALAISAGLKLYPAAFGILLLYEKRWKDALKTICYGVTSIIVPFFIIRKHMPEGVNGGINGIVDWALKLINDFFGNRPVQQTTFFIISIIITLAGTIFAGIRSNKRWLNIFYAGILAMMLGVQFQFSYAYVFLIPTFIAFMQEEKKITVKNMVYFLMFCIINLPLPIFGEPLYGTIPLVGEVKMWTLFIMMAYVTIIETGFRRRKGVEKIEATIFG